jgi:hypothetical protein
MARGNWNGQNRGQVDLGASIDEFFFCVLCCVVFNFPAGAQMVTIRLTESSTLRCGSTTTINTLAY